MKRVIRASSAAASTVTQPCRSIPRTTIARANRQSRNGTSVLALRQRGACPGGRRFGPPGWGIPLSTCLSIHPSTHPSIHPSIHRFGWESALSCWGGFSGLHGCLDAPRCWPVLIQSGSSVDGNGLPGFLSLAGWSSPGGTARSFGWHSEVICRSSHGLLRGDVARRGHR